MTPQRIRRSRAKGWKMPADTVVVTRPGKWGNPFAVEETAGGWLVVVADGADDATTSIAKAWNTTLGWESRDTATLMAVEAFRQLHDNETSRQAIREALKGRSLACWCPLGTPCHADVLLAIANDEASTTCTPTDRQPTDGNPDFPAPERQPNAPRPAAVEILAVLGRLHAAVFDRMEAANN